ncbi:MAG: hypothetical protein V1686_00015 [Patescibacteria group bacterium]
MEKIKDNLEWLKVSQLSVGMNIAVPKAERSTIHGGILPDESDLELGEGDIMWDEIVEIKKVGEEQVYDIEVEGTHNFVAGHLIDSNTKEKLSEQEEKEYLNNENEDKRDVFYGAIFAHNTYISGNVGIGTTGPAAKLAINGGLHVGGDSDPGDNNALIDGTLTVTGAVTLTTDLGVASGGTGVSTFTTNGILYGNSATSILVTAAGTSGQMLQADGTGVPGFVTFSGDATIAVGGAITVADDSHNHVITNIDTFTSAELATQLSNETGSGLAVFATSPQFTTSITTAGTFALNPAGALTIGDNGDTLFLDSSDWDISTTGAMTGISGITNDGGYTQTGVSANIFSGSVGIGDTNPSYMLSVDGTASISGQTIITGGDGSVYTYNNSLNAGYDDNAAGNLWLNYRGYNDGATQYRNLRIGDGKQNIIMEVTGSSGAVYISSISTSPPAYVIETNGILAAGGWVDMAEYMPLDSTNYEPGELISARTPTQQEIDDQLTSESFIGTLTNTSYDSQLIGVISQPGTPGLGPVDKENYKAITMVGRVPVKVSTENGPIKVGDYLTSSTTPGVAMKATKPGTVIGKALEAFSNNSDNSSIVTGQILVFVNLTWYDGGFTQILSEITDITNAPLDKRILTIDDLGNVGINATASISDDLYVGKKLYVDGMDIKDEIEKIKLSLNSQGTTGAIVTTSNPILPNSELMASVFQGLKNAGIEIVNGIVKIAQLMVKTLVVEKNADQTQSSIGEGVIKAKDTSVTIESNQVLPSSKIFVTFRTDYGSRWWIGYQEKGRFIVNIAEPLLDDIKFDWWIVQTEPVEITETASPVLPTTETVTPTTETVPTIETTTTPTTETTSVPTDTTVIPTDTTAPTTDTTIVPETVPTDTTTTSDTEPVTIIPETTATP